jgi:hypothetical protein
MAQEEQMKKTPNAEHRTSNRQKFRASAFGIGRWVLGVGRFP